MITHRIEVITPDEARELIARMSAHQRSVRRMHVLRLAQDIRSGKWMLTPDPIVVTDDGMVINGQHRLHAIIEADEPAIVVLSEGWPESTYAVMDAGLRRALIDRISDTSWLKSHTAIATVRAALGQRSRNSSDSESTIVMIGVAGEKWFEPIIQKYGNMGSPINSPILGAVARGYMNGVPDASIERFLRVVKDPALSEGTHESAAVRLRQAADTRKNGGGHIRHELFRMTMRGLQLFAGGEVVGHLKIMDRDVWPLQPELTELLAKMRNSEPEVS